MNRIDLTKFSEGAHIVSNIDGVTSIQRIDDVALAPLIAAGTFCIDSISARISAITEIRPRRNNPLTSKQRAAWENFKSTLDDADVRYVEIPSAREAAQEGVNALIEEADKLMKNANVKKAYDNFMMICKLTKEQNDANR
jgi:hypothetical protein